LKSVRTSVQTRPPNCARPVAVGDVATETMGREP
jgi:hypothetical protein